MNLTTPANDQLAAEIQRLHLKAEHCQAAAMDGINDLIETRISVAALVETAKANQGHHFRLWWESNHLPTEWAARYLTIAKTAKRVKLGDKNQLRLMGILPEPTGEEETKAPQHREGGSLEWIKLAGRLNTTLTKDRINQMDKFQRRLAIDKLKPLIEIYNELATDLN